MGCLSLTSLKSCYERCHPEADKERGVFPFSHCFQEKEMGWPVGLWLLAEPHPSSVIQDPPSRWGGDCCLGDPCAANSSRVKWEIFIPRVRERAGRRPRAGELGLPGYRETTG